VAAYLLQEWVGLPATMQIGSEMRYSPPPIDERTLVIGVSQSGETADTLAPLKLAAERGAAIVVVTNVVGSAITREADAVCYLQAGPEIAVASTKAFVTQVLVLQMIALHLAELRGTLSASRIRTFGLALRTLPRLAAETLRLAPQIKKLARRFAKVRDFIFIGRGVGFPIAMEGALKLKELSYVHAEGYAAGELKHGPIALLDPQTPLLAIATRGAIYEKVVSNVAEARARSAPVIAVATEGDDQIDRYAQDVIYVPDTPEPISPVIAVLPLQLLAYEIAVARGTDVDQPRNLAKSVTVE
jgi:glucosamine--fructose-6-phosphate aminotransferase (isomerizing)